MIWPTRPLAASPSPRPLNRPQQLPAAICPSCGARLRTHRQEGRGASPLPANSAGARTSGGSKGAEPPLASPECCTLGKLALPCERVKTGPVPLALPRPCVVACHPALCSAPIVGEGSRRWGHFRGSSATAARCSTGWRDDVSAPGPVSATRRIRPSWRAGAAGRSSSGWMDGWMVEYIKPLHKGGADEVGNKHLLCRECFEEKRH